MTTLTRDEVTRMAVEMHGPRWKGPLAEQLGLSVARVYQLASSGVFPPVHGTKLLGIYEQWKASGSIPPTGVMAAAAIYDDSFDEKLTDKEIAERIANRFSVMNRMVNGMIAGVIRSMIVFGAPGIGKTYEIEKALERAKAEGRVNYTLIKGTASAPGLYTALYHARNGGIVTLDDADSIFDDEEAFNILKSALDTTDKRILGWRKRSSWVYDATKAERVDDEDVLITDDQVPNEFEYAGGMIFITNIDFNEKIARETKFSPHFNALMSRSLYLDLTLKSQRARMIRIRDVFMGSMAKQEKLTAAEAYEIMEFVVENAEKFTELSLRCVKHVCHLYRMGGDWKEIVRLTKMKTTSL